MNLGYFGAHCGAFAGVNGKNNPFALNLISRVDIKNDAEVISRKRHKQNCLLSLLRADGKVLTTAYRHCLGILCNLHLESIKSHKISNYKITSVFTFTLVLEEIRKYNIMLDFPSEFVR